MRNRKQKNEPPGLTGGALGSWRYNQMMKQNKAKYKLITQKKKEERKEKKKERKKERKKKEIEYERRQEVLLSPPLFVDAPAADIKTGTVKWFDNTKGFGFITPSDGSVEVFVHQSVIFAPAFRNLRDGESVEFSSAPDHTGRVRATRCTGPNGAFVQGVGKSEGSGDRSRGGDRERRGGDREHGL